MFDVKVNHTIIRGNAVLNETYFHIFNKFRKTVPDKRNGMEKKKNILDIFIFSFTKVKL